MSFSASIVELVSQSTSPLVCTASHWERIPLGRIADILNGYPWKSAFFNEKSGTPIIRIRDVTAGKTNTKYCGEIVDGFWIEDGDLLVGMDGDFSLRVWDGGRALLNQRVCRITTDGRLYLPDLLARVLPGYLQLIQDATHSITVKHLSSKTLADIPLPLPPLPEQHRIVAKIDRLTGKSRRARDHLDHIPRLVEKYKQAVLAAAFRGDLTREWRTKNALVEPASSFIADRQEHAQQLFKSTGINRDQKSAQLIPDLELESTLETVAKKQPLPKGWSWTSLGVVFGVYIGATPSRKEPSFWNGSIPWVSSGEVAFCRITATDETISDHGLESTSTRVHPPGTVMIGMIGEGKTRGQVAILDLYACNNQNCAAIRVSEANYISEYVYWYLYLVYERTRSFGGGNNQPALNKNRVQQLVFPLAPPDEAREIARRIDSAFSWIDRLAAEATSARKLVDRLDQAILAKAFRGELVPQDPADEPASVLLERIRAERGAAPKATRGRKAKTA